MEKIIYNRDTYFIGENGIYLELQNTKEYIDTDGIKRIVIELKDTNKIKNVRKHVEKCKQIDSVKFTGIEDIETENEDMIIM
ncbi:hypothetical protein [Malaciobacter marinus]|jgi:ABC-type lipoprotein release transport system permease subunit|uniref:hypothetical protein n=1 Tax=Malaciobacter marinus TaxID=505249 RepID=UPI0009A7C4F1|nr:hypothetical protein [Malaciobacter marinus]SKB73013.1 hypothetical protein SAMN06295997_13613 [Malaciobacter marinus]